MLIAEHISFGYDGRPVISDLSVDCCRAEIVGIVGASGSGKTTVLNIFSGNLKSHSGSVTVDGISPREAAQAQKIGYVFQSPALFPWATVEANVSVPLKLRCFHHPSSSFSGSSDNKNSERRVQWALELAQIQDAAQRYPHELSGGMKARVALARAIVYKPRLLLLDESTTGLDDIAKENLYKVLQEVIAETEAATVLVGHDLSELILLCDRVYVLRRHGVSSRIVHCEMIPFKRPRGVDLFDDPSFISTRKRLREELC